MKTYWIEQPDGAGHWASNWEMRQALVEHNMSCECLCDKCVSARNLLGGDGNKELRVAAQRHSKGSDGVGVC